MSAPKLTSRTSSYRKPVPKFIPSPPASPRGSPTSSTRRFSFSHVSTNQDTPPLPPDWRNLIDRAVSREGRATSGLPAIDTVVGPSSHDAHGIDTDLSTERQSPSTPDWGTSGTMNFTPPTPTESCHDEELLVCRPSSPTPWEHIMRSTARQPNYQEEYRPPTPPIPNLRKRPRSVGSGCDSPTPTIISQLAPHSTLPLVSRESDHDAIQSISIEKSGPPPVPPKPLPTPPASVVTHCDVSSPSNHAGHDKFPQPPTYSPGHDRRPSTLNSTLNFTYNSDKWTEGTATPSAQGLIKTETPGNVSEFPTALLDRDAASRAKRSWWKSVASGFKRFMSALCCL